MDHGIQRNTAHILNLVYRKIQKHSSLQPHSAFGKILPLPLQHVFIAQCAIDDLTDKRTILRGKLLGHTAHQQACISALQYDPAQNIPGCFSSIHFYYSRLIGFTSIRMSVFRNAGF